MASEEALTQILLEWDALLLIIYVLGIGYIALLTYYFLKDEKRLENFYSMNLFDKIVQSFLLGFISLSFLLFSTDVKITDKEAILQGIGNSGLVLFGVCLVISIMISLGLYIVIYIIPNLEIKWKNRKAKKSKKSRERSKTNKS